MEFIEREGTILAFNPETFKFYEINSMTKLIMEELIKGSGPDLISQKHNVSISDINKVKSILLDKKSKVAEQKSIPGLSKLVLNISNACNLRCRYCYANGGNYKSDERMMTEKVAKDALDLFYDKFGTISQIQLFGGEPLLNLPIIEYVVKYLKDNGKDSSLGLVTNGTLIDDAFIDLVKKYNLKVTVSYDGDPLVNDMLRITKDKHGTSDTIINNIKRLYKETNEPSTIEVTYTQYHAKKGISIGNIISFIRKNIGQIPLHIAPAGGNKECDFVLSNKDAFIKAVDEVFDNDEGLDAYSFSFVQHMIQALQIKKKTSYLCEAGFGAYTVAVDGDVYPCFMFTDDEGLKMGNIYDQDVFSNKEFLLLHSKLLNFKKDNIAECKSCFMKECCQGCLGLNLLDTNDAFSLSGETCHMYREMMKQIIYRLFLLKKEQSKYGIAG